MNICHALQYQALYLRTGQLSKRTFCSDIARPRSTWSTSRYMLELLSLNEHSYSPTLLHQPGGKSQQRRRQITRSDRPSTSTSPTWTLLREQRIIGATRIPHIPSSEEECFMVRSTSSLLGKYLKSGGERSDRILPLANATSLVDPRVRDTFQ